MLECIENIVGLTRTQCNCFDGDLPTDYNAVNHSDSGYYITDIADGFPLIEAVYQSISCGDGNIYDVLIRCRQQAIQELVTNFGAALTMTHEGAKGFNESIGRTRREQAARTIRLHTGMQLRPARLRDASMTIKAISVGMVSGSGPLVVTIRSGVGDTLFAPQTITIPNVVAGSYVRHVLDTPINLPFHYDSFGDPVT